MNKVEMNKDVKLSPHLASPSEATLSQTNEFDGLRLSPHFTLGEMTKTSYITADGNIPSHVAIENLKRLCGWLEILRERYNQKYGEDLLLGTDPNKRSSPLPGPVPSKRSDIPVVISSGFRSEEVNRMCGGAKGSNHLTGCAVDIRCYGPEQMIRYACLLLDTADENGWVFDELIQEKRGTTYWIHFAVRPKDNRRKILFDCR